MANDEPGFGARAADRLISFSDAVAAIAITLLAIDLPVPAGTDLHHFLDSVRADDLEYLAFLVSFVAIASAWSRHHDFFRYARGTDPRVRTLHMLWLLIIVLIPFATKLLTTRGHDDLDVHALQWGFYALLQVLISAALLGMVHRMTSHDLMAPDTPPQAATEANWESVTVMLGFGLSIPVFFATPEAWVLWIVVPLAVRELRRHRRKRDGGRGDDRDRAEET